MRSQIGKLAGFTRFLVQRFHEDRCSQVAANLTFTTLLALVPMMTIIIAVVSAFPAFEQFVAGVKLFVLQNLVPNVAGKVITDYMEQFSQKAAGLTAAGIAMLTVTALMLMYTIDNAFNTIWRTRHQRPLMQRFIVYWTMLTLGPLLIGASISTTSYLIGLSRGWVSVVPLASNLLLKLVPIALTTIAFSLLYLTVPTRLVPRRHALVGGAIAGILFEVMKRIFADYLVNVSTYSFVYGTFASFPIFLLWLYFSWWVILVGAVITASLAYWHGDAWRLRKTPQQRFQDAFRVLRAIHASQEKKVTLTLPQLRHSTRIALEQLEDLIEHLLETGLIRKNASNQYFLAKRPEEIRLMDIYRTTVLESNVDVPIDENDTQMAVITAKILENMETSLELTLASVLISPEIAPSPDTNQIQANRAEPQE